MAEPKLTIIIPSFNESKSLQHFLPEVIDICKERNWDLIVINDGSTDDTRVVLQDFYTSGALTIIHHKLNRGYGAAIKSGICSCETEYCITIDADGQHMLEDIEKLFECLLQRDADMVVGSRKGLQSSSLLRSFGKTMIRTLAKMLMPVPIHDINSGMKIYRTTLAKKYLYLSPDTMAFSDMITLIFINHRHLVIEEPIHIRERLHGTSTIGVQTAFQTLMEVINILVLFNPMKIFLPLSVITIFVTLCWGVPLIFLGRGLSIGTLLGFISGILFFLLGLIAEQLSLIRRNQQMPEDRPVKIIRKQNKSS
ncbi:MAG: glycosyltransferase family 2 protein [Bacteroidetes bacterium]|nr:glycosyltransferase family 2 protein [Bacteroidota bacterium]